MNGTICVLGQTMTLPVIKNARPMLVAPSIRVTNLCKEILLPMYAKPKYKFSRAYWYIAEFDDRQYFEVEKWCAERFGPHPKNPDAWSRWYHRYQDRIHFRDEKDYVMFLLRWGV